MSPALLAADAWRATTGVPPWSAPWWRVRSPDDPEPLIAVGRVVGEISRAPRGHNGFGFDPVMFIPELGQTFAELPVD